MAFSPQVDIRRKILDAARDLLIEHGYTHLSIRMIARAVGCSVGTIYCYFDNKDALIHSLIEEGFEMLIDLQDQTEKNSLSPLERLKALCRNYISFGLNHPEYYEIMFMLKPERMARFPAEKYRRARRTLEVFAAALSQAAEQGLLKVADAFLTAHLLWSFMHGVVSLLHVKRIDRRIDPELLINQAVDQIILMNAS